MTTKYPPTKIEVFKPAIGEEEIDAVADVMRSGWLGRGPKVEQFESEWAKHIGVDRANVVSVGCATEGIYQVMAWISGAREREVIIPDNSFIGTASAVLESGMTLKLVDICVDCLNPDSLDYGKQITPFTAGIVFQHYGGLSHHIDNALSVSKYYEVPLIEDAACHPLCRPVGDFAVWSFDAMKILTCGDGGMVYCLDVDAANSIRRATRLGMDTESGQVGTSGRWWEFKAAIPGRRSLMNDIGAAIGLVQLRRLGEMVARREAIWNQYQSILSSTWYADSGWLIRPPDPSESSLSSYYTYWIAMSDDGMRDRLALYLRERGIYTTYRYWSVSKVYNWDVNTPNSHWASEHVLNLPLHPSLSDDDVSLICETIADFGRTL